MRFRSVSEKKALIAITGTLPPASDPNARISSSNSNPSIPGILMSIFYRFEALKRVSCHHDFCSQLTQEQMEISSGVVMILHHDNPKIG
jgi:hypothetical protein